MRKRETKDEINGNRRLGRELERMRERILSCIIRLAKVELLIKVLKTSFNRAVM